MICNTRSITVEDRLQKLLQVCVGHARVVYQHRLGKAQSKPGRLPKRAKHGKSASQPFNNIAKGACQVTRKASCKSQVWWGRRRERPDKRIEEESPERSAAWTSLSDATPNVNGDLRENTSKKNPGGRFLEHAPDQSHHPEWEPLPFDCHHKRFPFDGWERRSYVERHSGRSLGAHRRFHDVLGIDDVVNEAAVLDKPSLYRCHKNGCSLL